MGRRASEGEELAGRAEEEAGLKKRQGRGRGRAEEGTNLEGGRVR
jgi:hypothetical protein